MMVTAKVAAKAAGVSMRTLYVWLKRGDIKGKRAGKHGHHRIFRESLLEIGVPEEDIAKAERECKE